jgi:hypothetical protein
VPEAATGQDYILELVDRVEDIKAEDEYPEGGEEDSDDHYDDSDNDEDDNEEEEE